MAGQIAMGKANRDHMISHKYISIQTLHSLVIIRMSICRGKLGRIARGLAIHMRRKQ